MSLDANIFPTEKDIPAEFNMPRMDQKTYLVNGELREWNGPVQEVLSPIMIRDEKTGTLTQKVLGSYPMMSAEASMEALDAASEAYARGRSGNYWPDFPVEKRIEHVEAFIQKMVESRTQVSNYLMWEIAKSTPDSFKEFDRTITYLKETNEELKYMTRKSRWDKEEGIYAKLGRISLGTSLIAGPSNYPLNESETLVGPAVVMGNTIVFKPAKYGVLLNEPLLQAYQECFPKGVINTIYGDGETIITPLMKSGNVDVLGFIGSKNVSNSIIAYHPNPSHLKTILGLSAKDPIIGTKTSNKASLIKNSIASALSYNGQRCTAGKILFIDESIADEVIAGMIEGIDGLVWGMPWTKGVNITPMPSLKEVAKMDSYVQDALSKGAKLVNPKGGQYCGTFYAPALLTNVKPNMKIYNEEQFGPVVPIVTFKDISEPIEYMINSEFGQQASIFGNDPKEMGYLIDVALKQVARVTANGQSMRGPDKFPFAARKSSGKEVLSIRDALEAFSLPGLFTAPETGENTDLIKAIINGGYSKFLSMGSYPF